MEENFDRISLSRYREQRKRKNLHKREEKKEKNIV